MPNIPWSDKLSELTKQAFPDDQEMQERLVRGERGGGELLAAYNGRELAMCVPWFMDEKLHMERTERLHKTRHTELPVMSLFYEWLRLKNLTRPVTMRYAGFQRISIVVFQPSQDVMRQMIIKPTKKLQCPLFPLHTYGVLPTRYSR